MSEQVLMPESLDSGISGEPPRPVRELFFRTGYLSSAFSILGIVSEFDNLGPLIKLLERRQKSLYEFRWGNRDKIEKRAWKRAGKNAIRPIFVESDHLLSRYCRGRHQASAIVIDSINRLRKTIDIGQIKSITAAWFQDCIDWAETTPLDAVGWRLCPPSWGRDWHQETAQ